MWEVPTSRKMCANTTLGNLKWQIELSMQYLHVDFNKSLNSYKLDWQLLCQKIIKHVVCYVVFPSYAWNVFLQHECKHVHCTVGAGTTMPTACLMNSDQKNTDNHNVSHKCWEFSRDCWFDSVTYLGSSILNSGSSETEVRQLIAIAQQCMNQLNRHIYGTQTLLFSLKFSCIICTSGQSHCVPQKCGQWHSPFRID